MLDAERFKRRAGELALGHTVNRAVFWGFDFGLYPLVIYALGLWHGFAVMAGLSFLLCWATLLFYDWSKRDWLGIEAVKEFKAYGGPSRSGRWLAWALRQGDPVAAFVLAFKFDAFIVTAYLRRGRYTGMSARDWRNFVVSWLFGNLWWALMLYAGVETLDALWPSGGTLSQPPSPAAAR